MNKKRVLIVEDERLAGLILKRDLEKAGYEVVDWVKSGEDAVESVRNNNPDVILMDIMLVGLMNGIEATKEIQSFMNVPVIYCTGYSDDETLDKARATNPVGILIKPLEDSELFGLLEGIFSNTHSEEDKS